MMRIEFDSQDYEGEEMKVVETDIIYQLAQKLSESYPVYGFRHLERKWYSFLDLRRDQFCCGVAMEIFKPIYKTSGAENKDQIGRGCKYCKRTWMADLGSHEGGMP
jgi:hypothetical protein